MTDLPPLLELRPRTIPSEAAGDLNRVVQLADAYVNVLEKRFDLEEHK